MDDKQIFVDDSCPIRYDDGRNPWRIVDEFAFYYASNAIVFSCNNLLFLVIAPMISFLTE